MRVPVSSGAKLVDGGRLGERLAPRTRTKTSTNLLMQSTKRVSAPRFRALWAPGHSEATAIRGTKATTM